MVSRPHFLTPSAQIPIFCPFQFLQRYCHGPQHLDAKTHQMILFWLWRSSWLWPCDQVFPHIPAMLDMVTVTTSITVVITSSDLYSPWTGDLFICEKDESCCLSVCTCAQKHGCSQTRCWIPLELELKLCAALSSLMWALETECRQLRSHSSQWAISQDPDDLSSLGPSPHS